MHDRDYDWLVIGSGFGGSVSALRLAEKGYSVGVVECGRRFADDELPKSTWDLRRYFYAPRLGMRGIFRLSTFRDVAVVSGAGVGGGSLGYANTLYRAPKRFYENLLICDGSAIPANVGVNRSLTITALAEHALGHVPAAGAQPAEVSSRANVSKTSR